jgi:hypothetical protein
MLPGLVNEQLGDYDSSALYEPIDRRFVWSLALLTLAASACQPKFEPSGSLTIDSMRYEPTTCHVLTSGGIVLQNATGSRLELSMPPARIDAFRDIDITPRAKWVVPGKRPVELGPCGSMTLTGEGYHGSGKRAVSGRATLDCSGDVSVKGSLSFTGCF